MPHRSRAALPPRAFVYLVATAVISVPIAKRLGLGSVLGYLIGGVIIGRFGASLVGDQISVMHFAEFRVVKVLVIGGGRSQKDAGDVEIANKHFPDLKIIARAYDRTTVTSCSSTKPTQSSGKPLARRWKSALKAMGFHG